MHLDVAPRAHYDSPPHMSFATAFYNFSIELNHVDRDVFARFRVKTPRHPLESLTHLHARVLAYAHCYRPGQSFTQGLFEQKEPTIWERDVTGEVLLWVQVGVPERKKLEQTLRSAPNAQHVIYFYEREQIHEFCQMLRGSRSNWVLPITFWMIDPGLLEALNSLERSSPNWQITCVDGHLYLNCDGMELDGPITPISIWDEYQVSLAG